MMESEEIKIIGADDYSLSVMVFTADNASACVQVIHGMAEHKGRYVDFARFLAQNGYNVIIADLRGHGRDAPLLSHIADKNGDELLLEDERIITGYIKDRFKGLPVYIFAHSMGSIITRVLLQTDSNEYKKVALSGYVCPISLSGIALKLDQLIMTFKKPVGHSRFLTFLALGPYVMSVKNRQTPHDWLTYNEANVRSYIDDPLSGVEFTLGSYDALFGLSNRMRRSDNYKNVNKELKLLLLSGRDDPCAGGDKGRSNSKDLLNDAGFHDISVITYDGMRHEILNETDRDRVYRDVLKFLNTD